MLTCSCPAASALTSIDAVNCAQNFGQIQKLAFQRLRDAEGSRNSFTDTASILYLASWTKYLTAYDATKIVVTPYINNPTTEAGEARTVGGGNESLGGIETIIGSNPTTFTSVLNGMPQSVIKQLKTLMCEAQVNNLGVYLFNEAGQIACIQDVAGNFYPIPIRSLFVGDKNFGGFEGLDTNALSFSFPPIYSDDMVIVTPGDFNPLTDLVYSKPVIEIDFSLPITNVSQLNGKTITLNNGLTGTDGLEWMVSHLTWNGGVGKVNKQGSSYKLYLDQDSFNSLTGTGNVYTFGTGSGPNMNSIEIDGIQVLP